MPPIWFYDLMYRGVIAALAAYGRFVVAPF